PVGLAVPRGYRRQHAGKTGRPTPFRRPRDLSAARSLVRQRDAPLPRPERHMMLLSICKRIPLGGMSTAVLAGPTAPGFTPPAAATPDVFRPQLVTVDTPS